MRRFLAVLTLVTSILTSSAHKGEQYILSRVDEKVGMSHSAVLSLFQDSSGLIWFGTYDGLNCYDGRKMTVFRADDPKAAGLTNNVIGSVCQADDNCIWCATDYTLNKLSTSYYTSEVYQFTEDYSVYSNDAGNTWLISKDSLYYYNTFSKKFIGAAYGVNEARSQKAYVSPSGEFWQFKEDSGRIRIFSVSSFSADPNQVKSSSRYYDFHTKGVKEVFCQDGIVCFIDVDDDLYVYDSDNHSKLYIRNLSPLIERYGDITGIIPFYEDIYVGFVSNGLIRLCSSQKYMAEEINKDIRIYGLYKDNEQGILWVATDGQGAVSYTRRNDIATSLLLNQISPGLSRQVRSLMTDDKENLWIGTKGDGLVRIPSYRKFFDEDSPVSAEIIRPEGNTRAQDYVRASREFQVYTLVESEYRNGIWVGSGSTGLHFYSYDLGRLIHVQGCEEESLRDIHGIVERGRDSLYIATAVDGFHKVHLVEDPDGSLSISEHKAYLFRYKNHLVTQFYPVVEEGDSVLWVGSRTDGVVRFDCKDEKSEVISLNEKTGRKANDVLSLCFSRSGQLFVGTTSGLVVLDVTSDDFDAVYVGKESGLLNDMVHGILEDPEGYIWLSTNKGLVKYDPQNGVVQNYYYTSGVEIGEFCDDAYFGSADGSELFFGGVNGLLKLNSNEADIDSSLSRDLILNGMTLDGESVNLSDYIRNSTSSDVQKEIALNGTSASFSLTYVAPDFLGDPIEYSYMLKGYDKDWSFFSSSTEASYTSVPAGRYMFCVRYKKNIFDLDYKEFSIPIYVIAPWYRSRTASLIYLILLAAGLLLLFRYIRNAFRIRRLKDSRVGVIPDTGQDITDRMAVIYRCCDQLRSDSLHVKEREGLIDTIRDTLSGILQGGASIDDIIAQLPTNFVVSSTERIADISDDVKAVVLREVGDLTALKIDVLPGVTYPLYRNAIRRVIYVIYSFLASTGEDAHVIFEKDQRRWLRLVVKSSWKNIWTLYEKFTVSIKPIADKMGLNVKYFDKGDSSVLQIGVPPSDIDEIQDDSRCNIVFLTEVSDMSWLICDMLSASYNVIVVDDMKVAFEKVQQLKAVLLMVDMRLFENRENVFLEKLYKNHTVASKTSFLPLFTWNTDPVICRELILVSDAYMMLPYDILMLNNVVHKAIYGKGNLTDVHVEELISTGFGHLSPSEADFFRKVIDVIESNLEREDLGTTLIADRIALSTSSLYRKFKKVSGISIEVFIKNYRMEKAAKLLHDKSLSISNVISDVGISSRSYFYKEFAKKYGMTPKEYRDDVCSALME